MIKPVNGHLLIEPVKHDSFIASQKGTFEEIGIVIDYDRELDCMPTGVNLSGGGGSGLGYPLYKSSGIKKGDKVYFDSWLIAKYPDGKDGELWLVKWEDVRAIEHAEDTIPK